MVKESIHIFSLFFESENVEHISYYVMYAINTF